MAIERITINLPEGFNPSKHVKALSKMITDTYGDGYQVDNIDPVARIAYATRQATITEVAVAPQGSQGTKSSKGARSFGVRLARGTKLAAGDEMASKLEDQYADKGPDGMPAGPYFLTKFDPFLGTATMTRLEPETQRARSAVAGALGVKPWGVQVSPRPDGGFDLALPSTYTPSKHDKKLDEVATSVVGREGWYVDINPQQLTASIVPSDPPTFPSVAPFPFMAKRAKFERGFSDWAKIPLGLVLPRAGQDDYDTFAIDLEASPHSSIQGTSGSGKSVALNALIAGVLARGASLGIVDLPSKCVDFLWAKPFCQPGLWGCDSLAASVTTMALVYEEGQRRARVLAQHEVISWKDLPAGAETMTPLVIIVDELTGLFYPEKVPKGLPKDSPLVLEPMEINLQKAMLEKHIKKTAAELRFVGIKLVLSTQVASTTTGIDTSLRLNLGNKLLLGVNPTDGNRRLSLSDATRVPKVPANVQADSLAGRGSGVAELEGAEPCVFKSYFATTDQFRSWLLELGVPTTSSPSPTAAQIAQHTPSIESDGPVTTTHGKPTREMRNTGLGAEWMRGEDDEQLTGFAKANAGRHEATVEAKPVQQVVRKTLIEPEPDPFS